MAKPPGAIAGARIVGERFVHSQRRQNPEGRMPLMDHIHELRNRVVKMALALVAGAKLLAFGANRSTWCRGQLYRMETDSKVLASPDKAERAGDG